MKKIFLFAAAATLVSQTNAQSVAINNDGSPPTIGAMLDVKSANKGILIPRMALTGTNDVTTVPSRQTSLLIYNTTASGGSTAVAPGFYYWDGIAWVRLTTNTSSLLSGWLLGGNVGTSPSTHFIGTSDNNSLQIKVNNQPAGYIGKEANDGNVFLGYQSGNINTGYSNVGIGIKALFNNTSANNMVAIGDSALYNNTSGLYNTAVGSKSLLSNTTGDNNTANGAIALLYNTTGKYNSAVGVGALLANSSGMYNSAMGSYALRQNSTGIENTAVGTYALSANNGSSNTAIGSGALFQSTIGSSNTATGYLTLKYNSDGSFNTASGNFALQSNVSGNANSALGNFALQSNITGNSNSALGHFADVSTGFLSNATAIGANARVDCSNCLVLGSVNGINSATSNVNIGINETNPKFPLSFGQPLGDKISLWSNSTNSYGFGIQSSLLQIHTDISLADIAFGYGSSAAFTENMRIQGNGNLLVRGAVTANSSFYTSDARFKKNISLINNSTDKIILLNAYHFHWKDEQLDSSLQTGFLAQEVEKIFPELVRADNKGYLSVNYVGLIPYLVQTIKEQQLQIAKQNERIDSLNKENEELKKMRTEWMEMKAKMEKLLSN